MAVRVDQRWSYCIIQETNLFGTTSQMLGRVLGQSDELATQQQQLITADLTSIIVQLISNAGRPLPSIKHTLSTANPAIGQLGQLGSMLFPPTNSLNGVVLQQNSGGSKVSGQSNQIDLTVNCGTEQNYAAEEHDPKDDDDDADEGENLAPGSYEILQLGRRKKFLLLTLTSA
ncbi:hypothetical protein RJ641_032011 [Dillenia turbinata]|uniref:Uncharacterized protein n=1 Tax=Dillenia turbinata TaxID=194707 RepID=A0AAN8W218_9MAGN